MVNEFGVSRIPGRLPLDLSLTSESPIFSYTECCKKAPEFYRSELVNLFSWRKAQQMKINVSFDFFSFFQHVVCYNDYTRLKNPITNV